MEWIEIDGGDNPVRSQSINTGIYGIQVAQIVGQNPYDGERIFGLLITPDSTPIYFTEEAAERVIQSLGMAIDHMGNNPVDLSFVEDEEFEDDGYFDPEDFDD